MPKVGLLHTAIYFINFATGLIFTVTFSLETFNKFEGTCPLYLRLDRADAGVKEDTLPVCGAFIALYAVFQVVWPLLVGWLYGVASGLCNWLCNNACCCPSGSEEPPDIDGNDREPSDRSITSSELAENYQETPEAAVTGPSGVCHQCCFRVLLLDFRHSRMRSFRKAEQSMFAIIVGTQVAITFYFCLFLASLFMGYLARCSLTEEDSEIRLYHGDRFGAVRASVPDIMNLLPYHILTREQLCYKNPYTIITCTSAFCSFLCNLLNALLYVLRWFRGIPL